MCALMAAQMIIQGYVWVLLAAAVPPAAGSQHTEYRCQMNSVCAPCAAPLLPWDAHNQTVVIVPTNPTVPTNMPGGFQQPSVAASSVVA